MPSRPAIRHSMVSCFIGPSIWMSDVVPIDLLLFFFSLATLIFFLSVTIKDFNYNVLLNSPCVFGVPDAFCDRILNSFLRCREISVVISWNRFSMPLIS